MTGARPETYSFFKVMVRWLRRWGLVGLTAMCGCASYRPMPLTSEAVEAQLKSPAWSELRILAREIKHPILQPVELDPAEGLSPNGAAVLAVILNPSLRAARSGRSLSEAQLLSAGLLPNPEISYSLEAPIGGDTSGTVNAYGLELSWDATALLARTANIDAAKAHRAAVDMEVAWQEWQIAQAAKAAVYRMATLQQQESLADQLCQGMSQNYHQIQIAVACGTMTVDDLTSAQTAKHQTEEKLLDVKQQLEQNRLELQRLLGLPPDRPILLHKDIGLPSRVELPAEESLLQGLEQRRLDLLALHHGYDSQEAVVRAAIMDQFPKIVLGPTLSRDTDNLRTMGFGISIELPIFNRNQGEITRELATRQRLFDEYVNRVFEAHSDIEWILSGLGILNQQIPVAQTSARDLAVLAENYRIALADGRTTAKIYHAAWHDLLGAQMQVLELRGQLAKAMVGLELVSGYYARPETDPSPSVTPPEDGGNSL